MYVSEDAILDMMSKTLFGAVNAFKSKDLTKFLNDQQQELASISQDVALKTEAKADHADAIDATSRKVNADGTFTLQFSEKSKSPAVHDVLSVRDFTAENSVKVDYA
ncbi:hypothetical protein GW750_04070 [bacterium]|nr:hypothetical protein [bacterium]